MADPKDANEEETTFPYPTPVGTQNFPIDKPGMFRSVYEDAVTSGDKTKFAAARETAQRNREITRRQKAQKK